MTETNRYGDYLQYLLPDNKFKLHHTEVNRTCVDLAILSDEGILLSLRALPSWYGLWHTPGGTRLFSEPSPYAAKRIAYAETGLEIEIEGMIGQIDIDERLERGFGFSISTVLLCRPIGGILRGSFQGQNLAFFKEIPDNMLPEQRDFFRGLHLPQTYPSIILPVT